MANMPNNLPFLFQGDKEAMQTLLSKSAKLLATTVDENRRRCCHRTYSLLTTSTICRSFCTPDMQVQLHSLQPCLQATRPLDMKSAMTCHLAYLLVCADTVV